MHDIANFGGPAGLIEESLVDKLSRFTKKGKGKEEMNLWDYLGDIIGGLGEQNCQYVFKSKDPNRYI